MPKHRHADNEELPHRLRKSTEEPATPTPIAAIDAHAPQSPTGLSRTADLLGMQTTVGNNKATRSLGASGPTVARKADGPRPMLVQRANFSELMAFWKKQELGQETVPVAPKKGGSAPNLGPQVATVATGETAAMNPVIEEPKEAEKAGKDSSPVSLTRSGSATPMAGGKPSFLIGTPSGGKSDTPMWNPGALGGLSGQKSGSTQYDSWHSNALATSGTFSSTASSGGSFPSVGPASQVLGNKTSVKYLQTEEARNEFQLDINGTIKQGGQPYDTSKMYSKFKGDGFGIYVMGKDGRFFSTSHKIGLFHHSSFLGGGDVAGAGEMKVEGGELKYLTNKSGHYWPGDKELAQTIESLKKAGASGLASASLAQLLPSGGLKDPYPGGPEKFLEANPGFGGSGNKDAIKYDTKSMNDTHKGEDQDSLKLVREIIQAYVPLAKAGRLKKFNKPNSDFGNTVDDIKALVLAEFGWTQEDTITYAAVLENWNNTKTIGSVLGAPPMQASSPISMGSSVLNSSPVSISLTGSGGSVGSGGSAGSFAGSTSGRDWDEELDALLIKNPSPDFVKLGMSPYGDGLVIYDGRGGYRHPTAKDKVLLLTGEKTIDQLR